MNSISVNVIESQQLVPQIAQWLGTTQELMILEQEDTLVLKKLHAPKLSEIALRVPDEVGMTPEEVAVEVHCYRAEKRYVDSR